MASPTSDNSSDSIEEGRFPAGSILGARYRILGLLGRGGMGEVYRANDLFLSQAVALKLLPDSIAGEEGALARFRNEVRIARQVSHPNVCRVYDIGIIEGLHFLSMEYVDGEDLGNLLRRIGRLPQDKALEMTRRICAGLAAAHERGVLHRDLKPGNILIDSRGQVRLTDFGLAALVSATIQDPRSGTPAYMAPEQLSGREVTVRSDVYSLGLVMYEMFTGKRVFEARSREEMLRLREKPVPLPSSLVKDLDPVIDQVILRCLDPDPRNRPASALAVAMALPGGDPVAAALAAGETPSPEMVAASSRSEGLRAAWAIACFLLLLAALAGAAMLDARTNLLARVPLPLSTDVLEFRARQILADLGYPDTAVDSASGFSTNAGLLGHLGRQKPANVWEQIASAKPAAVSFWYRESPRPLNSTEFLSGTLAAGAVVTHWSPPNDVSGMIRVQLSPSGVLERLEVQPPAVSDATDPPPPDWNALLRAAGLQPESLKPAQPTRTPPVAFDARAAWTTALPPPSKDIRTISAAAWRGLPVYFEVHGRGGAGPVRTASPGGRRRGTPPGFYILAATILVFLFGAAIVAWFNVRAARGDRRGAFRLGTIAFALTAVVGLLYAHHSPEFLEMRILAIVLSFSSLLAIWTGVLYLAIEPHIRRHWPEALVSWTRVLGGRLRDPLVASHFLVGACGGALLMLIRAATFLWEPQYNLMTETWALSGARFYLAESIRTVQMGFLWAAGMVLLLVLCRWVARRAWLGDGLWAVIWMAANVSQPGGNVVNELALAGFSLLALRRFGLLTFVALMVTYWLGFRIPFASWYGDLAAASRLVLILPPAAALYILLARRSGGAERPQSAAPAGQA